ncbi:hypothetical protein KKF92_01590 [Patescibacteria group bacterium]|nr:hypothetical protein [Patescibacteria group bacterium]
MHKLDLTQQDSAQSDFSQPEPIQPAPTEEMVTQTPQTSSPTLDETGRGADNHSSLHPIESNTMKQAPKIITLVAIILAVSAGVATGFGSYRLSHQVGDSASFGGKNIEQVATGQVNNGDVFGAQDISLFKDQAEGYLEKGGINGEGSHKLLRPGGISQTVYLTSSVTDLDKLTDTQVRVWGETFKGQQAGWLMDVGRVEVIDTQAEKPI